MGKREDHPAVSSPFQVEVEQGLCWRRHIDYLKKLSSAPLIQDDQDDRVSNQ